MRTASNTSRQADLDGRVCWQGEDTARREEIRCGRGTTQDLKEDRDGGRNKGSSVDGERQAGDILDGKT